MVSCLGSLPIVAAAWFTQAVLWRSLPSHPSLLIIFQASVTRLIPLYAISVFLSFTLSQSGMALRWHKTGKLRPGEEKSERGSMLHFVNNWPIKISLNGFGTICTAIGMLVSAVTKFSDGAHVVLILIPALVGILWLIHLHYTGLAKNLSIDKFGLAPPHNTRHRGIMPVSSVHQGTLIALRYARILSDDVTAVHVMIEPSDAEKVCKKWKKYWEGVRMVMLNSPSGVGYHFMADE